MILNNIRNILNEGHEIEFQYQGNRYSITFGMVDGIEVVSFCEFYQPSIEAADFDQLLPLIYHGVRIADILQSISEQDMWVF